ncbi:MAG: hypothetical protein F6K42_18705 [Leptolyngbya sp. SIO1D8]|nr:hypothetical protein [Leptolyngbya sp. SIO1D8]
MKIEHEIESTLLSLEQFEHICNSILDLEIGLTPGPLMHVLDAPNITLRDAISYCRDTLRSELTYAEQGDAAENLAHTFSEVAHNLKPITLREAIKCLYKSVESLVILEQKLVRFKIEASLTICD